MDILFLNFPSPYQLLFILGIQRDFILQGSAERQYPWFEELPRLERNADPPVSVEQGENGPNCQPVWRDI